MAPIAAILTIFLLALAVGCGRDVTTRAPVEEPTRPSGAPRFGGLSLEPALTARRFQAPTNLVQSADGTVWVTEQAGRIWTSETVGGDESPIMEVLDITDQVSSRRSEEGLLGFAPDPANNGYVYLYYSAASPRRSVVSRFTRSADGAIHRNSELVILEVRQPYANHNGGQIAFGPDGFLYIGLGDGGSAGDPMGHGQDTSTLLGSILRIDVSGATRERPYAIPSDNPFADGGGRGEIWAYGLRNPWRFVWAYGLRNPWRFTFDRDTGRLWAGDVGQNRWEEIDLIERGGNYGWNVLEGNHCFSPGDACDRRGLAPPVWEYSLDGEPCSVIGGYVYRGSAIPWLEGGYVYGDFCSGEVFALRYVDGAAAEHRLLADTGHRVMSFGQDLDGELYLLTQKSGIFRLVDVPTER